MEGVHAVIRTEKKRSFLDRLGRDMRRYWRVYVMLLPVVAFYLVFKYGSMGYLVIAFQNFKPAKGILGSQWVGLDNFVKFFTNSYCWRLIRNTLLLNVFGILFSFPAPILLALMINEVQQKALKKTIQTISYIPHFISLVVVCGMLREFCSSDGLFNSMRALLGLERYNLLTDPSLYRTIHIGSGIWQSVGWSSIIYLATLSGVDTQLYEAAYIDGANKFQRILHVTLPALVPIITVQFIMRIGHIMSLGYEKIILLYNSTIYETADVISTYLYRYGLLGAKYGMGTAIGLMNSVINIIILVSVNKAFSRLTENSLW